MVRFGGIWKASTTARGVPPEVHARVKDMTRAILALPDEVTVSANEIICADPACPGSETVILVMRPGEKTRAFKVQKAMADVSEDDLRAALGGG
jgi:hypothetical protein